MVCANKSIFIIAGEKQSGKTNFLLQLLRMFDHTDLTVSGFVSLHQAEDDSYTIKHTQTYQEVKLMQRIADFDHRPQHFEICPEGVKTGMHWIQLLLKHPPHLTVIDEIGVYELSGALWHEGFTQLVNAPSALVFCTKVKHVKAIVERWDFEPAAIFYSEDFVYPEKAFQQIKNIIGIAKSM